MSTPQVDPDVLDREAPEEPEQLVLAGEFPEATREQWAGLVDGVLRKSRRIPDDAPTGAGVEALLRRDADGIEIAPLYTADDAPTTATGVPGRAPHVRGARAAGHVPDGWDVRQRHGGADAATVHDEIMADLENGAGSVWLTVGDGIAPADLPAVLADVLLDLAPVVLDAGAGADETAEAFLALVTERGVAATARGNLGLDPIGLRARTGTGPDPATVVPLARRVAEGFPALHAVVVDALAVHGAGGTDGQELGWSIAAGVAYLRALTDGPEGLDVATAAGLLEFRYAATGEQFPTIAKLRAARRLWARVLEASGAPDAPGQAQHAVVSPVITTRRDPWVNMLRGTVAGFAAGVGGADAVTVAPFDDALGRPEAFSRRIARNTQSLLIEEAHLARVVDPAGGSWYVESLTDSLARAGWAFFQEIEAAGGAVAALDAGLVAERTAAAREAREKAVATRKVPITGVSEFPDLDEKPVTRRPVPAAEADGGLPRYRLAEPYEARRDASDEILDRTGRRPTAFLATLGPVAVHSARAGFARNLLTAGGIAAPDAGPTDGVDEVVAAFTAAGTPVAVLCSSDRLYTERAADTAAALKAAGATRVLLAGSAEVPGVDGRLAAGGNALAVIDDVLAALQEAGQ